jgi:hypothetical protein
MSFLGFDLNFIMRKGIKYLVTELKMFELLSTVNKSLLDHSCVSVRLLANLVSRFISVAVVVFFLNFDTVYEDRHNAPPLVGIFILKFHKKVKNILISAAIGSIVLSSISALVRV